MSKLVTLLKQPWLITLLGVLALVALIWFVAPYIPIGDSQPLASPVVRLLIIMLVLVLGGLGYLYRQLQAARASNQMIDELSDSAATAAVDESAEEVTQLQRQFDEAMAILKKERKKGGAGNIYSLPWYIIIGPPAAGKTTALLNSGLKFPLQDRFGSAELKGIGGTRNCDWLFTDKAVLLDTAGRYVTQDSHAAVDSAAWEGFLNMLKQRRRRRPVNGVLVAVSLADLMQHDARERDMHVRAIKQRISELYEHFGMRLPVYVMLTKCDLVAGFTEYFDDLGREQRAQVWGFTLPMCSEEELADLDIAGRFNAEFDRLIERLNARLLTRLSQERDFKRRDLIFGFPRQITSLKQTLAGFLVDVFQPNRYEEPIMLRGVYLSSGTQEGAPIDRLMGTIARTFGLQQQALPAFDTPGRSYFINRLLDDVVFREAGLGGYDPRVETRRAWLQRGSYAGVVAITVLAALGWLTSYTANKTHINEVASSIADYQQLADGSERTATSVVDILPVLDALRAAAEVAGRYQEDKPLHMRLWLYQGGAMADAVNDAYVREMNNAFVPFIARDLETQLRRLSRQPAMQYEALKTYLMLGNSERMESQQVSRWMTRSWQNAFPRDAVTRSRLQMHLDSLLQRGTLKPAVLDARLVKAVRKNLEPVSLAELAYGRFKQEATADDYADFRVTRAVGVDAAEAVFVRTSGAGLEKGIPGLFTYEGFFKFYQQESGRFIDQIRAEDWVLARAQHDVGASELQQLDKDIRRLYIADYISSWDDYLADLKIVSFRDVRHATEVLEILSGPASPIVGLLDAVAHNTALSRLPGGVGGQAAEDSKLKELFSRLLESASDAGASSLAALPESQVDRHFKPLNRLVESKDNRPPPVEKLIAMLSELYGQLMVIDGGFDNGSMLGMSNGGGLLKTLQKLQVEGSKQPEPVKSWIKQVAVNSQTVSMGNARDRLNAIWNSSVRLECERALSGRYPFHKKGRFDVTIDDFGRFFAPGGVLDQFFQQQLKPLVDTSRTNWQWRSPKQGDGGFSSTALQQMQRAAAIRKAFFRDGGQVPSVHFELKPVYLHKQLKSVSLDLEGEGFDYAHGPQRFENAQWPGPRGSSAVRIVFKALDRTESAISEEGPWAWFRILDRATKRTKSPDRFVATFESDGRRADYEIRASSVVNPFIMRDLRNFRCPQEF